MPAVDGFNDTFDHLSRVVEKFTEQIGLSRYSLYLMDYGASIDFRLVAQYPERVESLISQNVTAYVEGVDNSSWEPIKEYWKDRRAINKDIDKYFCKNVTAAYQNQNTSNEDGFVFS